MCGKLRCLPELTLGAFYNYLYIGILVISPARAYVRAIGGSNPPSGPQIKNKQAPVILKKTFLISPKSRGLEIPQLFTVKYKRAGGIARFHPEAPHEERVRAVKSPVSASLKYCRN